MSNQPQDIVNLLKESSHGSDAAAAQLDVRLYAELRRLAKNAMRGERNEHTLQPTALVHEAFMRLMKDRDIAVDQRSHFLAASAVVMRRILVDHARRRLSQKRGGEQQRVAMSFEPTDEQLDFAKLHDALEKLAAIHERAADVVEKKFFGGMNYTEIGEHLGISSRTVQADWKFAKAWLNRSMDQA